jgi:hypothetical protein
MPGRRIARTVLVRNLFYQWLEREGYTDATATLYTYRLLALQERVARVEDRTAVDACLSTFSESKQRGIRQVLEAYDRFVKAIPGEQVQVVEPPERAALRAKVLGEVARSGEGQGLSATLRLLREVEYMDRDALLSVLKTYSRGIRRGVLAQWPVVRAAVRMYHGIDPPGWTLPEVEVYAIATSDQDVPSRDVLEAIEGIVQAYGIRGVPRLTWEAVTEEGLTAKGSEPGVSQSNDATQEQLDALRDWARPVMNSAPLVPAFPGAIRPMKEQSIGFMLMRLNGLRKREEDEAADAKRRETDVAYGRRYDRLQAIRQTLRALACEIRSLEADPTELFREELCASTGAEAVPPSKAPTPTPVLPEGAPRRPSEAVWRTVANPARRAELKAAWEIDVATWEEQYGSRNGTA